MEEKKIDGNPVFPSAHFTYLCWIRSSEQGDPRALGRAGGRKVEVEHCHLPIPHNASFPTVDSSMSWNKKEEERKVSREERGRERGECVNAKL